MEDGRALQDVLKVECFGCGALNERGLQIKSRWEGDELVVDTTHIEPSTITNNGLEHSANVHMVERYKLSPDHKTLMATQWFEDPEVLDNNGARYIQWTAHPGQYVYPYDCDPSFALNYQKPAK